MTPMKGLGNDIIMTRQMRPTLAAGINLRPFQIHHGVVLHLSLFAQGLVILVVLVLEGVPTPRPGIAAAASWSSLRVGCPGANATVAATGETCILAGTATAAATAAEAAAVGTREIVAFGVFGWGNER